MTRSDVAKTALFVAAVRARENERADPLFRDEISSLLAGEEGRSWLAASEANPKSKYRRGRFPYLEVRTKVFDDWLQDSVRRSRARQLVLLGAGMDTRAFRLTWPEGLKIFELDTPALFSVKEKRLRSARARPVCDRRVVEADLSSHTWTEKLVSAGFVEHKPTVWLAEGLLVYLKPQVVFRILEESSLMSSPGSFFGAEVISKSLLRSRSQWSAVSRGRAPWHFGTDDPKALFERHGWALDHLSTPVEAAIRLGRVPQPRNDAPPPRKTEHLWSWFVFASKSQKRRPGHSA